MNDQPTLHPIHRRADLLIGGAVFALVFALYVATLAPGLVFGDPAEYTFVPHIWGIAHPPGYAFQTVLGGLWQRLVPIGSIAYRANLLSAAAGAGIAALAYGAVRALTPPSLGGPVSYVPGLLAGASAGAATDIWQHSLHANAHIVSALLATASLFLLLRWWRSGRPSSRPDLRSAHPSPASFAGLGEGKPVIQTDAPDRRWLFAFCVVAGLSVTHHPLLAFSFPAYAVFILVVWPGVVYSVEERRINWRTPLAMIGFALLGLSVWLYLPLRASLPAPLLFGPDNTNTLDGFLDLALARGLRVNLFHFGLSELPDRLLVFWSLLRLQASLPVIGLMAVGLIWLWARRWRVALLYTLFVVLNVGFIINTIQDVMAYLMVPFGALLALAGVGAIALFEWVHLRAEAETRLLRAALALTLLAIPLGRAALLAPSVSLRNYREAEEWVEEVYDTFEGKGEGAILLNHWEHLTPLWYEEWVEGRPLDEADVRLVFVATTSARPWVDNVWANIDDGPVYVSGYQRELIDEGFRLRPVGLHMYRVLPPPAVEAAEMAIPLDAEAGPLMVVGVDLPLRDVLPGEAIPLSVALSAPETPADIIFPYTTLTSPNPDEPPITFQYTTDSHWLTPYWEPGEVIVERYDLRAPLLIEPGEYDLRLGLRDLSTGEELTFADGETTLDLGTITIGRSPIELPDLAELMADIGHQAGLEGAVAMARGQRRAAVWQEPLSVEPGDTIRVRLTWTALSHPDTNYKVFVHLIDGANRVIAQQDAPPLGGAFPTFLWFPKWAPGQTVADPYRLTVPEGTPPGEYWIEVGMYGFTTFQRAPFFDLAGNLTGDRFILGAVWVGE